MGVDCAFCEIVAGEQAAHVVCRTDRTVAFLDENPAARGHTLVIPTDHCEEIVTAPDADTDAVFETVSAVADALDRTLDPDGFSVFHTSGPLVGTVHHAHVHVVPRFADDGIGLSLTRDELDEADAERLAERLAEGC